MPRSTRVDESPPVKAGFFKRQAPWPALLPLISFVWVLIWLASPAPAAEPSAAAPPALADYPQIIAPLPKEQLNALRAQFARENPTVCVDLNRYGFTTAKSSCSKNRSRIGIEDEDAAIDAVGAWLTSHARFTGVAGHTHVELKKLIEIHGCATCTPPDPVNLITELRLYFPRQLMLDLPVEGDVSQLVVFINAEGVFRVKGYWLPDTTLPLRTTVSSAAARHALVGTSVSTGGDKATGRPHLITNRDLRHVARRVVFVNESSRGLEVRVAWKIPVGATMVWTAYVDAITGEVLRIITTPKREPEDHG